MASDTVSQFRCALYARVSTKDKGQEVENQLGRPRVFASRARIESLRASGASWRTVAKELGIGEGTARRIAQQ